jgi:hypothetical protein
MIATVLLASCSCIEPPRVDHLGVVGSSVYARVDDDSEGRQTTYLSEDGGLSWRMVEEVPSTETPSCGQDGTCFRLVDNQIQRSTSSNDWDTVWSIPLERANFVQALGGGTFGCGEGGRDMVFTSEIVTVDSAEGTSAVVAMGDQGVVVVGGDGMVSRVAVSWPSPTPFTQGFSGYALETVAAVLAGLVVFWALTAVSVVMTRTARRPGEGRAAIVLGVVMPAIIGVLMFGAPILALALVVLFPVGIIAAWSGIGQAVPRDFGRLLRIAFFGSLAVSVGALIPFELWARGTINSHNLAVDVSVAVGIVAAAWLVYRQWVISRRALEDQPAS